MILFRPTGLTEMRLIFESDCRAFPPRLPEQPIFYPVLNLPYARQIAEQWNTKVRDLAGYVTRFEVEDAYASRFERHIVGGPEHEELWVPAEELSEFNQHFVGRIGMVEAHFGPGFRGHIPDRFGFKGRDAVEQFVMLVPVREYSPMDFMCEIGASATAVFLHFPFWAQHDFSEQGISLPRRDQLLADIRAAWASRHPEIPLAPGVEAKS